MLFLVFFITAFIAVISDDLVEVTYNFEENYLDVFSDRQCVNSTQWSLVSYGYLELVPPYEGRSKSIRALSNSCTSSFPIVFLKGALEATVYLRTISKYSGITMSVFDERDEVISAVRYQRSKKNFMTDWVTIAVPINVFTTGYVQISGQSLNNELVLVDSLRYIPGNSTFSPNDKEDKNTYTDLNNEIQVTSEQDELIFSFAEIEGDDEIESSGDIDTEPSVTEDPDHETEDPDGETEDPNTTEEQDTSTPTPNPETDPEGDRENSGDDGFWNAFTITFVSVGAFTAVGLVAVGAYHLGKSKGVNQNSSPDLESLEAPSIIPRARSVFSRASYDRYDRFGRYN